MRKRRCRNGWQRRAWKTHSPSGRRWWRSASDQHELDCAKDALRSRQLLRCAQLAGGAGLQRLAGLRHRGEHHPHLRPGDGGEEICLRRAVAGQGTGRARQPAKHAHDSGPQAAHQADHGGEAVCSRAVHHSHARLGAQPGVDTSKTNGTKQEPNSPSLVIVPPTLATDPTSTTLPPPYPPADITSLNNTINTINTELAPILPQLNSQGINLSPIPPVFIRQYIPILSNATVFSVDTILSIFSIITQMITDARNQQNISHTDTATAGLFSTARLAATPTSTGASSVSAQSIGAGAGIGGATLFSSTGNIGQALTNLLANTTVLDYIQGIYQKAGVVGGLAALANLPTSFQNFSQFGVVQGNEPTPTATTATPATTATAPTTATPPAAVLTQPQQAALAAGVNELVTTVSNVPQLSTDLLKLLKALGPQQANEDEIKQLLSLLVFLQQLLALLVGAAASAAGGGVTNIDHIVQQAFATPANNALTATTTNLTNLGVTAIPPGITPSNPTFLPTVINAINNELTPAQQLGFVAQITNVFTNNGVAVTLPTTIPTEPSLGTAVNNALAAANITVAGQIRQQLNPVIQNQADQLLHDILSDENRRPSLASRISAVNPSGVSAIPPQKVEATNNFLNHEAPNIPGITPQNRNAVAVAVANGAVTPQQASNVVSQFLHEEVLRTNPAIAHLLPVTNLPVTTPLSAAAILSAVTVDTSGTSVRDRSNTPSTEPGTAGQLPNTTNIIVNGFKTLAKHADDSNFTQEIVTRFANAIRGQTDFYYRSLGLILDPANTYVKNFSVVTRQTSGGHDPMGSISQIPISG